MTTNILVFALAAFFEIAGCFAFWVWLRRGAPPYVAVLGVASLIGFAIALTRTDSASAGRAYAGVRRDLYRGVAELAMACGGTATDAC